MPEKYYEDDLVTLYHGDCREVLASMEDESADCVLTDPPYSAETHEWTRTNNTAYGRRGNRVLSGTINFGSITLDDLTLSLAEMGRISSGWVVSHLDFRHAFTFDATPPPGLRLLRIGVWVKTNPNPQISGDRPAQGWEAIAYLHRSDRRPSWSGGGKAANFVLPSDQGTGHPTAKPPALAGALIRLFTNPGDLILDPFAGSGTTLRAAKDEGRRAIGVELDERYCEIAAKRLAQDALFGEVTA